MSKSNYLTKSKKNWGYNNWQHVCPAFTFKKVNHNQFPDFLPSDLSTKLNCGYFAASGTSTIYQGKQSDFYIGFFVGLRIDRDKIDEQPYVSVYNQESGELVFDGYLQHGNYDNRTTQLSVEQLELINSSGITVDIKTNRLPDIENGHLNYLVENRLIRGLEITAIKSMEEVINRNCP